MSLHIPDTSRSFTENLIQGYLSGVHSDPDGERALLICYPSALMNKYQALLYKKALDHKFQLLRISSVNQLEDIFWPGPIVFHAHWFASIFNDAEDDDTAIEAVEICFEHIRAFKERTGAKLVWTAHNLFPHNKVFANAALLLRQKIFETFDNIHFLNRAHKSVLEDAYDRKSPASFVVPHMTYDAVYPAYESVSVSRAYYGLSESDFVFGFFGSIQEYKGLEALVEKFNVLAAQATTPIKLLMCGNPSDESLVSRLKVEALRNNNFVLDARRIPDIDVQFVHKASDVMVFPYVASLNSGAAFAAMTFDRPMIAPDTYAFSFLPKSHAFLYDPKKPSTLSQVLKETYTNRAELPKKYKTQQVSKYSADRVSSGFFDNLNKVVGRT